MAEKQDICKTALIKIRKLIRVEGVVQGVGFRPTVFRLAQKFHLSGWVKNDSHGVLIEIEGYRKQINQLIEELGKLSSPIFIKKITITDIPVQNDINFLIRKSQTSADQRTTLISPDLATCETCISEIFDSSNRRFHYAFTNCTNCGPRYTIITDIPYDRPNTTMRDFKMCQKCLEEYHNPQNRRFHAQPNACPQCGPQLQLIDLDKNEQLKSDPIKMTHQLLTSGKIIAIKGIGGFHLACDARNEAVVTLLRKRKVREDKAFALMCRNLNTIRHICKIHPQAEKLLKSPTAPIVILRQKDDHGLAESVAPYHKTFGVMLPYTPLHHLLLNGPLDVLVMTSGNITDEPIIFEENQARKNLRNVADFLLTHNRPIYTRCDDSVIRFEGNSPVFIRRSRGYAPDPIELPVTGPSVLACGAELKSTFCLTRNSQAFLSEYIGDLKSLNVILSFKNSIEKMQKIFQIKPEIVVHDLHPDYFSTRYAQKYGKQIVGVQHHYAHALSCMAENAITEKVFALILDGTGWGFDGTVWGGEILLTSPESFQRLACLKPVPLPGGDSAVLEPWRMGMVYIDLIYGSSNWPDIPFLKKVDLMKWQILKKAIQAKINSPYTSSAGRLFDAVSAILGIRLKINYEGQAAIELEQQIERNSHTNIYHHKLIQDGNMFIMDPTSIVAEMIEAIQKGYPIELLAQNFHCSLVEMFAHMLSILRQKFLVSKVVLSGGVFQNIFLLDYLIEKLENIGFKVYTHKLVPANDGGVSLGQAYYALWKLRSR